jgi:hypothetical protein
MSSILEDLKVFAWTCARDHDVEVVTGANECLRLCDSLFMPRVPALLVVNRADGLNVSKGAALLQAQSAASLIEDLKSAREEISVAERNARLPVPSASEDLKEKAEKKKERWKACAVNDTGATTELTETSTLTPDVLPESTTELETQLEETTTKDTPDDSEREFAANLSLENNLPVIVD